MENRLYLCNPYKNTKCKKTSCYLYKDARRDLYSDCYMTKHKEFELKPEDILKPDKENE